MDSIDYRRLSLLGDKVKANRATKAEKDEFMSIMHQSSKITQAQYNDYLNQKNSDDILNAALAIGAIALLGYLIGKLLDK